MKKIWYSYWMQTSPKWRRVGDALLFAATSLGLYTLNNPKWQDWKTILMMVLLIVGKVLTNFSQYENKKADNNS